MTSPRKSTKWLVVSAWEPELTRFRELAVEDGVATSQRTLVLEPIGIGVVDAAIGMTRCIERHRPDAIVFVGTCGSFGAHAIGDVVVAKSITLIDRALVDGASLSLFKNTIVIEEAPLAIEAPRVSVANTIGVTVNDDLAARLAGSYDVEHLEAFAVARAASASKLPCTIVLGVANMVGKDGSAEWKKNHERVSGIVAERFADALRTSRGGRSPEPA